MLDLITIVTAGVHVPHLSLPTHRAPSHAADQNQAQDSDTTRPDDDSEGRIIGVDDM